jgi:hypothetical protein
MPMPVSHSMRLGFAALEPHRHRPAGRVNLMAFESRFSRPAETRGSAHSHSIGGHLGSR